MKKRRQKHYLKIKSNKTQYDPHGKMKRNALRFSILYFAPMDNKLKKSAEEGETKCSTLFETGSRVYGKCRLKLKTLTILIIMPFQGLFSPTDNFKSLKCI